MIRCSLVEKRMHSVECNTFNWTATSVRAKRLDVIWTRKVDEVQSWCTKEELISSRKISHYVKPL